MLTLTLTLALTSTPTVNLNPVPKTCERRLKNHMSQIFCLFGADKDTDLSYTYDVKAFTADTPSSPSKACAALLVCAVT